MRRYGWSENVDDRTREPEQTWTAHRTPRDNEVERLAAFIERHDTGSRNLPAVTRD